MNDLIRNVLGGIAGGPRDPYFNYTTLLLPGTGTNGAQNGRSGPAAGYRDGTFLDSSSNNFTITRNGNTTQGTFSPFSQTGWAILTENRSYLSIPQSADFELINTDFTFEFWINFISFNTMGYSGNHIAGTLLSVYYNGWEFGFSGSGSTVTAMLFQVRISGVPSQNNFPVSLSFGAWYHVVLQRTGSSASNLRLFVNGTIQGAAQTAVTYSTAGGAFTLGSGAFTQNATYSGNAGYYISNVRLTKSSLYDINGFISPTTNLEALTQTTLLIGRSNRLRNLGTNTGTITSGTFSSTYAQVIAFSPFAPTAAYSPAVHGGSGYFDGTLDVLIVPNNVALQLGQTYTIEGWFYPKKTVEMVYFGMFTAGAGGYLFHASSTTFTWEFQSNGAVKISGSWSVLLNSWNHIAISGNSSVLRIWLNGGSVGAYTTPPAAQNDAGTFMLGYYNGAAFVPFEGYQADFRVIKGTALYNPTLTNIPVPTAPLTAITNTSLLLNFTNAGITDATAKNVLETVDGAQIRTTINNPFGAATGTMYFDGSGDYLAFQNGPNLNFSFGTANFTIEGWIYLNTSTTQTLLDIYDANSSGRILLQINTSRQLQWLGQSGVTRTQTSSSIALSTWTHFSVCRASGSTRIFIGGTQGNTTYPDTNNYTCTTGKVLVGINAYDSAGSPLNGYISNLRITKGFARHTANFTPPTTPFALR